MSFVHETGAMGHYHYPEIMGAGLILFDYDGDKDLDIYFINGNFLHPRDPNPSLTNRLYRNDLSGGTLRFTDVTGEAGLDVVNVSDPAKIPAGVGVAVLTIFYGLVLYCIIDALAEQEHKPI